MKSEWTRIDQRLNHCPLLATMKAQSIPGRTISEKQAGPATPVFRTSKVRDANGVDCGVRPFAAMHT